MSLLRTNIIDSVVVVVVVAYACLFIDVLVKAMYELLKAMQNTGFIALQ